MTLDESFCFGKCPLTSDSQRARMLTRWLLELPLKLQVRASTASLNRSLSTKERRAAVLTQMSLVVALLLQFPVTPSQNPRCSFRIGPRGLRFW